MEVHKRFVHDLGDRIGRGSSKERRDPLLRHDVHRVALLQLNPLTLALELLMQSLHCNGECETASCQHPARSQILFKLADVGVTIIHLPSFHYLYRT